MVIKGDWKSKYRTLDKAISGLYLIYHTVWGSGLGMKNAYWIWTSEGKSYCKSCNHHVIQLWSASLVKNSWIPSRLGNRFSPMESSIFFSNSKCIKFWQSTLPSFLNISLVCRFCDFICHWTYLDSTLNYKWKIQKWYLITYAVLPTESIVLYQIIQHLTYPFLQNIV